MIDNRDCKKCRYDLSDECISCTPEDSNFEPKEKKMKVKIFKCSKKDYWYYEQIGSIVNVCEEPGEPDYILDSRNMTRHYIIKSDCEPVQEGWLTEEQFVEIDSLIWRMCHDSLDARIKVAKQRDWIKQSKTARQELFEKIEIHKAVAKNCCRNDLIDVYDEIKDLAIKALEAEKK